MHQTYRWREENEPSVNQSRATSVARLFYAERTDMTLTDTIINGYLDWAENRARLSKSTVDQYSTVLRKYSQWLDDRPIDSVTFTDVEDFGNRDRDGLPPSPATARKDIVVVRNLHRWASERDHPVRRVDSARSPKVAGRSPKPVDDDVWVKVWNAELDFDDRMFLTMGYFFGLRRVEIVTISPQDVDLDRGEMRFKRKGGSTQPIEYEAMLRIVSDSFPHLCPEPDKLLGQFSDLVRFRHDDTYLYPDSRGDVDADCNRLNKRIARNVCRVAGVSPDDITPHRLRHSCATNMLRAGVEPAFIMDALSHADITTTMRYMKTSGQLSRWHKDRIS